MLIIIPEMILAILDPVIEVEASARVKKTGHRVTAADDMSHHHHRRADRVIRTKNATDATDAAEKDGPPAAPKISTPGTNSDATCLAEMWREKRAAERETETGIVSEIEIETENAIGTETEIETETIDATGGGINVEETETETRETETIIDHARVAAEKMADAGTKKETSSDAIFAATAETTPETDDHVTTNNNNNNNHVRPSKRQARTRATKTTTRSRPCLIGPRWPLLTNRPLPPPSPTSGWPWPKGVALGPRRLSLLPSWARPR